MRLTSAHQDCGRTASAGSAAAECLLRQAIRVAFERTCNQPNTPWKTTLDTEKRRYPRFECTGIGGVRIASSEPPSCAKIVDLSVEGCLMVLQQPESVPQDLMVELTFNVNWLPFRVRALVKVIRSSTMIGFQFHQVSKRTQLHLEDLIEELAEPRPRNADDTRVRSYNGR
jgi:hypothetical protein